MPEEKPYGWPGRVPLRPPRNRPPRNEAPGNGPLFEVGYDSSDDSRNWDGLVSSQSDDEYQYRFARGKRRGPRYRIYDYSQHLATAQYYYHMTSKLRKFVAGSLVAVIGIVLAVGWSSGLVPKIVQWPRNHAYLRSSPSETKMYLIPVGNRTTGAAILWREYRHVMTAVEDYDSWFHNVQYGTVALKSIWDDIPALYSERTTNEVTFRGRLSAHARAVNVTKADEIWSKYLDTRDQFITEILSSGDSWRVMVKGQLVYDLNEQRLSKDWITTAQASLNARNASAGTLWWGSSQVDKESLTALMGTARRITSELNRTHAGLKSCIPPYSLLDRAKENELRSLERIPGNSLLKDLWTPRISDSLNTVMRRFYILYERFDMMRVQIARLQRDIDMDVENLPKGEDQDAWFASAKTLLEEWAELYMELQETIVYMLRRKDHRTRRIELYVGSWEKWKEENCGGTSCYGGPGVMGTIKGVFTRHETQPPVKAARYEEVWLAGTRGEDGTPRVVPREVLGSLQPSNLKSRVEYNKIWARVMGERGLDVTYSHNLGNECHVEGWGNGNGKWNRGARRVGLPAPTAVDFLGMDWVIQIDRRKVRYRNSSCLWADWPVMRNRRRNDKVDDDPVLGTLTNLIIILGMMQVSKKIPFEDPTVLNGVRALYIGSNILIAAIYGYVLLQINKKKDLTTLKYVEPAPMGSSEEGKLVTTTVQAYDAQQIKANFRSQLMGLAMMGFMHLYMKYTNPLVIQSIIPLKGAFESNLVQIHLFGKPASGDLKRPFKQPAGFMSGLQSGAAQSDKKAIEAAERSGRGGVKDE
ncbi:hypothetical protein NUW58_g7176 [Xylaria curta]|uniref:Uncharacterized protein n=1 Tax=Xylaria curta TaxID=42375 RepID=A0ACC1NJT2_9PEZI|nr:hypothetical protein NUW58_g7176 [Xylaria curta]